MTSAMICTPTEGRFEKTVAGVYFTILVASVLAALVVVGLHFGPLPWGLLAAVLVGAVLYKPLQNAWWLTASIIERRDGGWDCGVRSRPRSPWNSVWSFVVWYYQPFAEPCDSCRLPLTEKRIDWNHNGSHLCRDCFAAATPEQQRTLAEGTDCCEDHRNGRGPQTLQIHLAFGQPEEST